VLYHSKRLFRAIAKLTVDVLAQAFCLYVPLPRHCGLFILPGFLLHDYFPYYLGLDVSHIGLVSSPVSCARVIVRLKFLAGLEVPAFPIQVASAP
jgi:hypothetical protein